MKTGLELRAHLDAVEGKTIEHIDLVPDADEAASYIILRLTDGSRLTLKVLSNCG